MEDRVPTCLLINHQVPEPILEVGCHVDQLIWIQGTPDRLDSWNDIGFVFHVCIWTDAIEGHARMTVCLRGQDQVVDHADTRFLLQPGNATRPATTCAATASCWMTVGVPLGSEGMDSPS